MEKFIFLTVWIAGLLSTVRSVPINNRVFGEPEVECLPDGVIVIFNLDRPFRGHIYVKGLFDQPECRTDDVRGRTNFAQYFIRFDTCGTVRTRSLEPRGVFISNTVILKFHPFVLTKIDRAVKFQCFYMEADKTVDQQLEVDSITTEFQTFNVPMPVCRYEILDETEEGDPVRFAIIGQKVYHKWTCDTETQDVFCMFVYGCFVNEERAAEGNNIIELLDDSGCSNDEHLLANLEYSTDLMGGVQAHVFKFADRPYLYFNCQINISVKEPGLDCPRPQCPSSSNQGAAGPRRGSSRNGGFGRGRGKRNAPSSSSILGTVDVRVQEPILVADVDMLESDLPRSLIDRSHSRDPGFRKQIPRPRLTPNERNERDFCFSPTSIGISATLVAVLAISAVSAITVLALRRPKLEHYN